MAVVGWTWELLVDSAIKESTTPVFVRGFAAFAEGVGEKLSPAYPEEKWYLVAGLSSLVLQALVHRYLFLLLAFLNLSS